MMLPYIYIYIVFSPSPIRFIGNNKNREYNNLQMGCKTAKRFEGGKNNCFRGRL